MMKHSYKIAEYLDIVQISYDEPNSDENFSIIKKYFPFAKRVKNIKGFDNSHSYAASICEKDWILILDGDLKITSDLLDDLYEYFFLNNDFFDILNKKGPTSWCAKNIINGLIYGNGGPKIWPKNILLNVNSHNSGKLDWISEIPYLQMNMWYGYSVINCTPYQAWRAGFRESIKFCWDDKKFSTRNPKKDLNFENYMRFSYWMNVGRDVLNGIFAIAGSRIGCWDLLAGHISYDIILDYDNLKKFYEEKYKFLENDMENTERYIQEIGTKLRKYFDIDVIEIDSTVSEWIKKFTLNPKRSNIDMKKINLENILISDFDKKKT